MLPILKFVWDNVIVIFITSFFTVLGGATPIAILIFKYSEEEKTRLNEYADSIEKNLPYLQKIIDQMTKLTEQSINSVDINQSLKSFKNLVEVNNILSDQKKFIRFARNYNFVSAVGHVLRKNNYIPKNIDEYKEIAKNLPE